MAEENFPSIREILGGLRPPQLWGLGSSVVAILLGSFWFGMSIEKTRSEALRLEKEGRIAELHANYRIANETKDKKISNLENEVSNYKRAMQFASDKLNETTTKYAALEDKAEFLNRYVSYLSAPVENSKKLFSDYVCIMWKSAQERRLHFDRKSINISIDDLKNEIPLDVQRLLQIYGISRNTVVSQLHELERQYPLEELVPSDPIDSIEVSDFRRDISRQLRKIRVTKTVTFFDGTKYEVPEPVAIDVHARTDCAPR